MQNLSQLTSQTRVVIARRERCCVVAIEPNRGMHHRHCMARCNNCFTLPEGSSRKAGLNRSIIPGSQRQVPSLIELENKDMFDAPLAGSTLIIVYLFREVSRRKPSTINMRALCFFEHLVPDSYPQIAGPSREKLLPLSLEIFFVEVMRNISLCSLNNTTLFRRERIRHKVGIPPHPATFLLLHGQARTTRRLSMSLLLEGHPLVSYGMCFVEGNPLRHQDNVVTVLAAMLPSKARLQSIHLPHLCLQSSHADLLVFT